MSEFTCVGYTVTEEREFDIDNGQLTKWIRIGVDLHECGDCGAIVRDTERHAQWHSRWSEVL